MIESFDYKRNNRVPTKRTRLRVVIQSDFCDATHQVAIQANNINYEAETASIAGEIVGGAGEDLATAGGLSGFFKRTEPGRI